MIKLVFLVCQTFSGICYTVEVEGFDSITQCAEMAQLIITSEEAKEAAAKKISEDAVFMCIKGGEPA